MGIIIFKILSGAMNVPIDLTTMCVFILFASVITFGTIKMLRFSSI